MRSYDPTRALDPNDYWRADARGAREEYLADNPPDDDAQDSDDDAPSGAWRLCPECHGTGDAPYSRLVCSRCHGSGEIKR